MSCYFLAQIHIKDEIEYEKYLAGYDEIFKKYKGKIIAVDDNVTVLEGSWGYRRAVLTEFPNEEELRAWYDSPEYQMLAQYRRNASDATILAIHGR